MAQLIINEGSNKNYQSIADEDNEYPDWIEIYNASSQVISLSDYYITDDSTNKTKWNFPSLAIAPQSYILVFCSGLLHF